MELAMDPVELIHTALELIDNTMDTPPTTHHAAAMFNLKLGWPAALRPDASSSKAQQPASPTAPTPPPPPTRAKGGAAATAAKHTALSGIPASIRYFAIFDPRPPALPDSSGKGKGKGRQTDTHTPTDADAHEGGAGDDGQGDDAGAATPPPSTTVLFYTSPSEPTTTQATIQRRLGLASAIVHFSTDISRLGAGEDLPEQQEQEQEQGQEQEQPPRAADDEGAGPDASTPLAALPRWSVHASKTRTLTMQVRRHVYLHVVLDLPRLPRPAASSAASSSSSSRSSRKAGSAPSTLKASKTVKWEYVNNAVHDKGVFAALAVAWNDFVARAGEPPDRINIQEDVAGSADGGDEAHQAYVDQLGRHFMPWVVTWDVAAAAFPRDRPAATVSASTGGGTLRGQQEHASLRRSLAAASAGSA